MDLLSQKKFSFISNAQGLTEDTFAVVSFRGFEGISRPYEFDILLVSENPEIDLDQMIQKPARFVIHREDGRDVRYHGILQQFEQLHEAKGYTFYRASLSPKLWWLSLTHHQQVCLGKSVSSIVEKTLIDGGLAAFDFDFRLQEVYPDMEYVCQYGESHLNFVSRWLEREGIYYFFEQSDSGEKVVFTDTRISHTDLALEKNLYYSPPSGLDSSRRGEVIQSFTCRQRQLPRTVLLRDYNYEKPSLEISGSAEVDPKGRGNSYLYGEHFSTPEEGNRLAAIRAQELLCRRQEFFGESTVPFLMTGFTFTLNDHYRSGFNRKYLITEVTHEGSQTEYLTSGIADTLSERESRVYYHNTFTAIPADVQFRPERTAEKPRIAGTMHARVDAEGSGVHAELDDQGRYKVRLPFDIDNAHGAGKASSYVRMAQPYAGSDHGMHFPLHKGTEVLLTFVDGDPDRPIIAGAIPNPETPSVVGSANNASGGFSDGGSNFIMHNSDAGQRITMTAGPDDGSAFFSMGTGSSPGAYSDFAYEAKNVDFVFKSGIAASFLGALSQNMTAQSILWAFMRLATKSICENILENDRIGKQHAKEHGAEYNGLDTLQQVLLTGGPIVFSMIFTSQMSLSMARHLKAKAAARPMVNFGPRAIALQMKLSTKSGRFVSFLKLLASPFIWLFDFITGWSATYGVVIFNNTSGTLHGLFDPTSGSAVKLNPRKPDILIASGYGHIDIDSGKSILLNASDEVILEGSEIILDTGGKVYIGGGNVGKSTITIEPDALASTITLESGGTKISVNGDVTSPQIELIAAKKPLIPLNQAIRMDDMSVFIGNTMTTGFLQMDNIGITMSTKTGSVEIAGAKGKIEATTDLSLAGIVSTNLGSSQTAQVNINAQMLTMNGKFVKIGSDSILKAQATMIQLG